MTSAPWLPRRSVVVAVMLTIASGAMPAAHVGSPDVFVDAYAGPYRLLITVRPPYAIPGVADVEVQAADASAAPRDVLIVPMPLTGAGARFAPASDRAVPSPDHPGRFAGHLWMMTAGAWQIRVTASGDRGSGVLSVPVPTLPQATRAMSRSLRALLFGFMLLLAAGFIAIVSTAAREAGLEPGAVPTARARRRGRIAGAIAAVVITTIVMLGNWWWQAEAARYDRYVYRPLELTPAIEHDGRLMLHLGDPGWIASRRLDDFVDDHDHVMHLFVLSPDLRYFWHLHPRDLGGGSFDTRLPAMPGGSYALFADLVHATGVAETAVARLDAPLLAGAPLTGDDSALTDGPAVSESPSAPLADGGRMVWIDAGQPVTARSLRLFQFRVDDETGRPAGDLDLYMGMPGHAVFVKRDLTSFAHVHPAGSAPMAALAIGARSLDPLGASTGVRTMFAMDHGTMAGSPPATMTFPYGLPAPGDYRVFVQVKRRGQVETAAFDMRAR